MQNLKIRNSLNHWVFPEGQCDGTEWSRKNNLKWTGRLDAGGAYGIN